MIAFVVIMMWTADPWRHSIHVARLWSWATFVAWAGTVRSTGSRLDAINADK